MCCAFELLHIQISNLCATGEEEMQDVLYATPEDNEKVRYVKDNEKGSYNMLIFPLPPLFSSSCVFTWWTAHKVVSYFPQQRSFLGPILPPSPILQKCWQIEWVKFCNIPKTKVWV